HPFLKQKTTYQIISPHLLPVTTHLLLLPKHSPTHPFKHPIKTLPFKLTQHQINNFFQTFKNFTHNKKEITHHHL
ncbi:homocitrate synthase/isopropylmalate synthase family protein, partial [Bacillus pumilus]|uniref:homocitrate synthase/isopropylmalate synthase family protein n=1 Tax=Bacillus pumilus TaxID=1408 RepID=UPI003F68B7EC